VRVRGDNGVVSARRREPDWLHADADRSEGGLADSALYRLATSSGSRKDYPARAGSLGDEQLSPGCPQVVGYPVPGGGRQEAAQTQALVADQDRDRDCVRPAHRSPELSVERGDGVA